MDSVKLIGLRRPILVFVMCMLALLLFLVSVTSFPLLSTEYYGVVFVNDSPCNAGSNITAYDEDGTLCGYFEVVNDGYFGSLTCNSDDTDTSVDEGAVEADDIEFFVNGTRAVKFGNASFNSGEFIYLNLSVKNYPPYFTHNLSRQKINESMGWVYDVNCSDLNIDDVLFYYVNTSLFNISISNGLINYTPVDEEVGNHSVLVTCSDGLLNTSEILIIEVLDVANRPVLQDIPNQIAVEGEEFTLQVVATDNDVNDTLIFSTNSTLFAIDSSTGLITFTPTIPQIGNYTINVTVTDGIYNVSDEFHLRIVRGAYCGDGFCAATEDCSTCSTDCGACPYIEPSGEGGGGSGSTETGDEEVSQAERIVITICIEKWECAEWSECSIDGLQNRKCIDINNCATEDKLPRLEQDCDYIPTCFDGVQNGNEIGVDCGGECAPCLDEGTCDDGIKNQGEEGIDCGGPCEPCKGEGEGVSLERLAPLFKTFPWWLIFLIILLLLITVSADRSYIAKIKKLPMEDYVSKRRRYLRLQRRIYLALILFFFFVLNYSLYLYYTSDHPEILVKYFWVPGVISIAVSVFIYILAWNIAYIEFYRKKKSLQSYLEEKRIKRNILLIEDNILISMESKLVSKVRDKISKGLNNDSGLLTELKGLLVVIKEILQDREEKVAKIHVKDYAKLDIKALIESDYLIELAKDYVEFKELMLCLKTVFNMSDDEKEEVKLLKIEQLLSMSAMIARDKQLRVVIMESKPLVKLYNKIVDVYNALHAVLKKKDAVENLIIREEEVYQRTLERVTSGRNMSKIESDKDLVKIYNLAVDLYNHYKREKEFRDDLKQIEKERAMSRSH